MTDSGRPQDQGRSHRRARSPSPETAGLLERWRVALRSELEAVIVELTPAPAPPGLLPDAAPVAVRPALERRRALVELGDKIARALGDEVDPTPPASSTPPTDRPRRPRKVEY